MLVLCRKRDQAVVFGGAGRLEDIVKITVIKVDRRNVTLGIDAKSDVPVYREEVWERIRTSHFRDRPTGSLDRTGSQDAKEMASVLSVR